MTIRKIGARRLPRTSKLQVASLLTAVAVAYAGCGSDSATAPSNVPQVTQGTVALGVFQLAVVNFVVDRAGALTSRVDWGSTERSAAIGDC